ncbi:MAG: alpha/beta fold hydrolase, partial [Oscillochloris sp.]|nr:alpha/beta fold hydrolase [Oscillochloris sp.]
WHFTVVPPLREHYRLTTYDLRGHGRSEMPPDGYTTRDMAADLLGLMDGLGIERANLLGHSLGADIALHFALLHPERVDRIIAIEAGLAALADLRKSADWPGWAEWARGIEEYGGIRVPKEKWHDIDYMLRTSLEVPIVFGPGRACRGRKSAFSSCSIPRPWFKTTSEPMG